MGSQEYFLSDQTKEYMKKVAEKSLSFKRAMESKVNHVKDENNYIQISIGGDQRIQSITLADILLDSPDKQEVAAQLCRRINQAIQVSNRETMEAMKGVISPGEQVEIFAQEQPGVLEKIELLRKNAGLSLTELGSMRKTVLSKSGNIRLVISGAKIILSLEMDRGFLSSKNKKAIEDELLDCVNTAIQETENEISRIIKSVEAAFYERIDRG